MFNLIAQVTPIGPDSNADALFGLSANQTGFLLGAVVPFLIALVTKASTAAWVKKTLTIVLSAVAGLVTVSQVDGGGAVFSRDGVEAAIWSLFSAVIVYWTTLRNSTTERTLQEIGPADGGGDG